ncbi:MAG: flagellar hook-associated protein FlgK, partial [Gammaproteobacteria bacterium]|nr:flagellar hook-associated protein FlgK [Gammaproteobacteria bacterium]
MAGDIFGIGTSGLLTSQRQLATASHNISNVNTEGYTRQRAEQEARRPQFSGSGYIGTGVEVQTTVRLANDFLEEQIRNGNSQFGRFDAFHALSTQIDNVLANPDSGLTPTLESFFSALQEVNDNPSSTPARQVLLTETNTLTDRFKLLDDRFIGLNNQVNQHLVDISQEITDAARSIARLNADIVRKIGAGQGDMPNDLIDQREVLIKKISENVDVSVVLQDDGAANLFIGSGQSLVIGATSRAMSAQKNSFNAEDFDIMLTQITGSVNITNQVSGGELQGVLDFKSDVLESSRRSLGRIAIALSEELNAQHQLGMTLQGTVAPFPMGGNFFTELSGILPAAAIQALPGQATSAGDYRIEINNSRVLSTSDYRLDFAGGNFTLTKLDDTTTTYTAASIAALNTAMSAAEGFTIVETAAAAANESFLIRPTFTAAANIGVEVNNVLDIALAGPIVSGAATNTGAALNSGTGEISLPSISNTTNIPLLSDITLTFDPDALGVGIPGFTVVGGPGGILAYNPVSEFGGKTFSFAGFGDITFEISGKPNLGDAFVISNNTSPYDDNRNGLLMAKLQTEKTLENSSTDFQA